ncbi:hypothetical protein GOBAR_DD00492 [Gossypium barbadense]|nr:hypothetical protein GOBAR_DD00492 [Gossypium barbadense]
MRIEANLILFFWAFSIFSCLCFSVSSVNFGYRFHSSAIKAEQVKLPRKSSGTNKLYKTKYFTQILDHFNFNPKSYQKFQHRYLINDTYWGGPKKNSPIFVYTGNEGDIEWFAQNTGFMFDIAPHFQALLVFIEHRFYGKSIPFGGDKDVAYSNASTLGYLTSTQALADYATLIIDLKKNLTAVDAPVVVVGGSYGGSMIKIQFKQTLISFLYCFPSQFVKKKKNQSESENCYKVIKGSWKKIEDTGKQSGGLELLRKSFRICKNFIDVDVLESWLETAFAYTAMTDYPTPSNFLNPMPAYPVKQMCKAIDDPKSGNDTFAKLYGAASVYYNYSGTATCFNLAYSPDPHGLDMWSWQACTEMIMPTSGSNKESIFPENQWNYSRRAAGCKAFYGVHPRPNWITTEFGGHDIYRVLKRYGSNMIFFNGLRDPWSGGGVLKNISKTIVAIVAEQGAHHVDLRFATKDDPKWLRDVRQMEINIISDWISQYYHDLAHQS